jgi:hypothetical protein
MHDRGGPELPWNRHTGTRTAGRSPPASEVSPSLTQVLVEQHPDQQRERVAAEQVVSRGVLGDPEGRSM